MDTLLEESAATPLPPAASRRFPYAFAKRHGVLFDRMEGGAAHLFHRPGLRLTSLSEARRLLGMPLALEQVSPELMRGVRAKSAYNGASLGLSGIWPVYQEMRTIQMDRGRPLSQADCEAARRVVVVGFEASKQLFADRDPVGAALSLNGVPYTVVGRVRHKDQDSNYTGADNERLFIPYEAARKDFPLPGEFDTADSLSAIIAAPYPAVNEELKRWVEREGIGGFLGLEATGPVAASVARYRHDPALQAALDATTPISRVASDDYDIVFLPGGHGTMWDLPGSDALAGLVARQPGRLHAVHVAVVPLVVDVHAVQTHEVNPAIVERVVVRPAIVAVHGAAVQRMVGGDMGPVALDPEVLVIARHGVQGHADLPHLGVEQLVVARRFGFTDAQRVAHQVPGDEREVRTQRVEQRPEPPRAVDAGGTDVCI